jgi:hypothetical protein
MTRFVDRGAITAAYVGIGMAVTIAVSFLLVIPIEPVFWWLAIPAGLLIGYYANQRSGRGSGPWTRIMANALFAAVVTGVTFALLLLAVKALFFYADNGYRDRGQNLSCQTGADCVYQRYLADRPEALAEAGIRDAAAFERVYWDEQRSTALSLVVSTTVAGAVGGVLFGLTRPKAGSRPAEHPGSASA